MALGDTFVMFFLLQIVFGPAVLELSRLHLYEECLLNFLCNLYNVLNVFESQTH